MISGLLKVPIKKSLNRIKWSTQDSYLNAGEPGTTEEAARARAAQALKVALVVPVPWTQRFLREKDTCYDIVYSAL